MTVEFTFSEFNSSYPVNQDQIRKYFPEASIRIDTEATKQNLFADHSRAGWRMHDYNQLKNMLQSDAEIAIALDADMEIVSEDVRTIIHLTKAFGLCLPANPRLLVRTDTLIGTDSDKQLDETKGTGYAFNTAIIALQTKHFRGRQVLFEAMTLMRQTPMRLPLALWRAAYMVGFSPCLLPPQWCVCEGQEGCGNEIILHIGHQKVREFYGIA